ncbi:hypothetical protein HOP61_21350 [Halomonas daqingensis]|uniref:Uncharacterized protein n=1 Tax=Billgrantia desiderata TaxID=52021 RepID=A0AAW4YY96_9GAMM|nr:hypothetical protein [Halomonas desiderata]MCE8053844.1 hypothetical protein [Halomonas desiderata]
MGDYESILRSVKEGKHLSTGENELHQLDMDLNELTTRDLLDVIRFDLSFDITNCLTEEFKGAFYSLPLKHKIKIAVSDEFFGAIKLFLLTYYPGENVEEIKESLATASGLERTLLLSVIIEYGLLSVIPNEDHDALLEYFVSKQVKEEDVPRFSSPEFVNRLFEEDLYARKMFYVWICENLKLLLQKNLIDTNKHLVFFKNVFSNEDYIQGSISSLLQYAMQGNVEVFYKLLSVNLRIDPFTKETDYSQWLKDAGKFLFLAHCLQEYFSELDSKAAEKFKSKFEEFCSYNYLEEQISSFTIHRKRDNV